MFKKDVGQEQYDVALKYSLKEIKMKLFLEFTLLFLGGGVKPFVPFASGTYQYQREPIHIGILVRNVTASLIINSLSITYETKTTTVRTSAFIKVHIAQRRQGLLVF